ncbi:aldehyde-activating protein [Azorhizobium oxalatiphilum]|uniref:Aldehyde-activating protein n=1 Tax=Azorhizobium oxalatiphilum TaxID=980631 RepID=A0A917BIQ3_9HYPH|nr:GFA family protein [Azorhizobium oxalatiphilum]GGF47499.1 aldehyde-activating protein [Azorhizobium oxalatiphilum]
MLKGRCHCGAIHFRISAAPVHAAICHCSDCRGQSGAPMLAWAMVPAGALTVEGEPAVYKSSESGRRSFCGACGTGLFFVNAPLEQMGMIQVRIAALETPEAVAPRLQVQVAERLEWMTSLDDLASFERFPG